MALVLYLIILMDVCTFVVVSNNPTVPNFSSIIGFGDSIMDSGNNNYLVTAIKANHLSYGRDFPKEWQPLPLTVYQDYLLDRLQIFIKPSFLMSRSLVRFRPNSVYAIAQAQLQTHLASATLAIVIWNSLVSAITCDFSEALFSPYLPSFLCLHCPWSDLASDYGDLRFHHSFQSLPNS
ncbi:hypothetical protein VNO78_11758 [Psophocarpus tetragonolobus]|uniref:GDSL esterase/lipase n=1 Tax=Psophocarpus tetragonolobus TaxID=3891 RepID=A0AAN9SUF5_PSOTE